MQKKIIPVNKTVKRYAVLVITGVICDIPLMTGKLLVRLFDTYIVSLKSTTMATTKKSQNNDPKIVTKPYKVSSKGSKPPVIKTPSVKPGKRTTNPKEDK